MGTDKAKGEKKIPTTKENPRGAHSVVLCGGGMFGSIILLVLTGSP
jgi:hypothetical protein